MSRKKKQSPWVAVASNLGWPLMLGLALCTGFYVLVHRGVITDPLIVRYFAGHPVEYIEAAMFFVGLAALLLKMGSITSEFFGLSSYDLGEIPTGGQAVEEHQQLQNQLTALPSSYTSHRLFQRLDTALEHVGVTSSASSLQDELKYLSEQEEERAYQSYSLVRIVIWATPMLGFLGTVIGITLALGNLSPAALVESPEVAMESLLAGLSIAFDTTALALSLAILLMFGLFFTERIENELLSAVDSLTNEQLIGRFQQTGSSKDPSVAAVQRMSQDVIKSTEMLVNKQSEIWRETIHAAHHHWQDVIGEGKEQLQKSLQVALGESLKIHAFELAKGEQQAVREIQDNWKNFENALIDNARLMQQQQHEMTQQGEIMLKAVEATGQIATLEDTLNRNLKTLSGTHNFEDTVMSLAAAIHLLNSRIGQMSDTPQKIELNPNNSQGKAA
ncbi:MAG: hypothetical protein COA78_17955 [Blastopirellula sp.]|nr:MAG: hypothetical protein COA78_17955 [Blastopirellula sp.]